MSDRRKFPTFCHISEFDKGYERLGQMIALSRPLTLWSPSWNVLEASASTSGITGEFLCRLIDRGYVRVAARDFWIENSTRRQQIAKRFEGAEWTRFDEQIREWSRVDSKLPLDQQRVQIVCEEDGYHRADEFLANRPETIPKIERIIRREVAPPATLDRIRHGNMGGLSAAREVLRDARNHGQAISETQSRLPFLSLEYVQFIGLINEIDDPGAVITSERRKRSLRAIAKKSLDLIDDLARLGKPEIATFAGSDAHEELADWMADITDEVIDRNVTDIEPQILNHFRKDLDKAFPEITRMSLRAPMSLSPHPIKLLEVLFDIFAWILHPSDFWHAGTGSLMALEFATPLLQSFGYASLDCSGFNWPFLYVFDRKPRVQDLDVLRHWARTRIDRLERSSNASSG